MMDKQPSGDWMLGMRKIKRIVPQQHFLPHCFPFRRSVEYLIQPAVKSECIFTNSASQLQISKTFKKGWELNEFTVSSH
jgi:hypothetical protein